MRKRKKIQVILVVVILALLAVVLVKFIGYRRILSSQDTPVISVSDDARVSIGKVEQTAVRNGITEWQLEARTAKYLDKSQQVFLKDLSVTFYLENGANTVLTAEEGILNKVSNDIEVSGKVLVKDDRFTLETERLRYDHSRRIIKSEVPVRLISGRWDLTADAMSMDLESNKTRFKGSVNGKFKENLSL